MIDDAKQKSRNEKLLKTLNEKRPSELISQNNLINLIGDLLIITLSNNFTVRLNSL